MVRLKSNRFFGLSSYYLLILLGVGFVVLAGMGVLLNMSIGQDEQEVLRFKFKCYALFMLAFLVLWAVTVAFFIAWCSRAYMNLRRLEIKLEFHPAWAVIAWFIPFLNWQRPYFIVSEIWYDTQMAIPGERKIAGTKLVGWWWALFLAGSIGSYVGTLRGSLGPRELPLWMLCWLAPSLVLSIIMMKRFLGYEEEMYQARTEMDIMDHLVTP